MRQTERKKKENKVQKKVGGKKDKDKDVGMAEECRVCRFLPFSVSAWDSRKSVCLSEGRWVEGGSDKLINTSFIYVKRLQACRPASY